MKPRISIRRALADPNLFGKVLAGDSWAAWRIVLIASMGEALTDAERAVFKQFTSRDREPGTRIEELTCIIGRRGGKTRALSTLAIYLSCLCDHSDTLSAGEIGVCLLIAQSQNTAKVALDYCTGIIEASPILSQLIEARTADTLRLKNNISIEVRTASFRRLRGPTYIAALCDELAFWLSEDSANPDTEIVRAIKPGLATTRGPLICASSPYSKRGELWNTFRRHYGSEGDPLILVCKGASRDFNPSLSEAFVNRELEKDRESATGEYLAEFRNDISGFVTYEIVQSCVGDFVEQAPREGVNYFAFVDPSGGSADAFTLAISHAEGTNDDERVVIDALREVRPPFSPEAVCDEFSTLLKTYRINLVRGDRYAGEWPREQFKKRDIGYVCSEKPKSDLYRDLLPLLNSGKITLPKSERLVNQLCGLERRTARSGKDSIDHAPNSHDDLANAVAGAAQASAVRPAQVAWGYYGAFVKQEEPPSRLREEMRAQIPKCLIDFNTDRKRKEVSNG